MDYFLEQNYTKLGSSRIIHCNRIQKFLYILRHILNFELLKHTNNMTYFQEKKKFFVLSNHTETAWILSIHVKKKTNNIKRKNGFDKNCIGLKHRC